MPGEGQSDRDLSRIVGALQRSQREHYVFHLSRRHTISLFSTLGVLWVTFSLGAYFLFRGIHSAHSALGVPNWVPVLLALATIWPAAACARALNQRVIPRRWNQYENAILDAIDKKDTSRFDDVTHDLDVFLATHSGSMGRDILLMLRAFTARSSPNSVITDSPDAMKKRMKDFFTGLRNGEY